MKGVPNLIVKPNLKNLELAYETGFHLGDATMIFDPSHPNYYVTYYGNNKNEREFYEKILLPLLIKLFGINSKVENNKNTCYIRIYSKDLTLFKQSLGLPIGNKIKLTKTPKFVKQTIRHLKYFIAGLFDSDGTVKRIIKNRQSYPMLSIALKNKFLIEELHKDLRMFEISSTYYKEKRYDKRINKYTTIWKIDINGFENLKKFLKCFRIRNLNHLKRLKEFNFTYFISKLNPKGKNIIM